MKPAVIVLSRRGLVLARRLGSVFPAMDIFTPPRLLEDFPKPSDSSMDSSARLQPFRRSFAATVEEVFQEYRGIIFISAVAVAVRAIAPHLVNKAEDPAVVVVDGRGRFAVSLLSGHLGGANSMAEDVARCLDASPVITTATDGCGLVSFDGLAARQGWVLENLPQLKHISAAQLEGREIVLYTEREPENFPSKMGKIRITRRLEDLAGAGNGVVLISNRRDIALPSPGTPGFPGSPGAPSAPGTPRIPDIPYIIIRPRNVAAGVGCRKGVPPQEIIAAVYAALEKAGLVAESLSCLATGVFKEKEAGLLQAARHFRVPLRSYTREEILPFTKDCRTSPFVQQQVGVGAVAEPCARLGSGGGRVVLPCRRSNGVTVALAEGSLFSGQFKGTT